MAFRDVIDSKRLMMFYHVASHGSLSKAEAVLLVAQPAISRQISRLEEDLGVQLLNRHGRGVTLTPFGEILYRQAEIILQEMQNALDQIDIAKRQPAGRVSVSASAIVMSVFMPEIVNRLMTQFPEIDIVAVQAASGEIYNALVSGKVDVAIVMQVPSNHRFSVQKLSDEPMVVIASRKSPIAAHKVIRRDMLATLPVILPAAPNGLRGVIENYARAGGISMSPHLQVDSVPLIKGTIAKGHFCAVMPLLTFHEEFGQADYVALPLQPALTRPLYAATRNGEARSIYVDAMLKITIAVFLEKGAEVASVRGRGVK